MLHDSSLSKTGRTYVLFIRILHPLCLDLDNISVILVLSVQSSFSIELPQVEERWYQSFLFFLLCAAALYLSHVSFPLPLSSFISDLQDQLQRAMMLEQERRRAEEEAARLEAERQAALLAKEELARQAENQKKSQEQLVSILFPTFISLPTAATAAIVKQRSHPG